MPTKTVKKIRTRQSEKLLPATTVYRAKVDSKRRIVLRSTKYEYYNVYEREDGSLLMTPQIIADTPLSADTLKMIDSAMKNMKKGIVSKPIDLNAYLSKKKDR